MLQRTLSTGPSPLNSSSQVNKTVISPGSFRSPPRVELSVFACEIDVAARLNAGVLADEFQILEIQDAARHPMIHGHRGWLIRVKSRCQYVEHEVQRADNWHATEVRLADAQRA